MKTVFLSYAHQDSQAAQELHASLHGAKVSGWMDKADIASGESVAQRVKDAPYKGGDMKSIPSLSSPL